MSRVRHRGLILLGAVGLRSGQGQALAASVLPGWRRHPGRHEEPAGKAALDSPPRWHSHSISCHHTTVVNHGKMCLKAKEIKNQLKPPTIYYGLV